jgi:hypothetical protein
MLSVIAGADRNVGAPSGQFAIRPAKPPPAPVVFAPNLVGQLVITNDDNGVRLLLSISSPAAEDIMVFGQAPCSSGRL